MIKLFCVLKTRLMLHEAKMNDALTAAYVVAVCSIHLTVADELILVSLCCGYSRCSLPEALPPCGWETSSSMSRVSSTAKRYAGPSYTSHYSSYTSSLTPGLSSYSERDRLSSYKSPTSSSTSSSGYSSSSYLSSSVARSRNYSTSSDPDRDRGRTIPRTDILGSSSSSRRSESLSRTPVKSYGGSGLSGGSAYTGYSSFSSSATQSSYLSSSPVASSIALNRRKSVSQSDLSRDLASLGLNDTSSSSSSIPTSSTSALRSYRSRTSDVADSYGTSLRSGYSGLSRSSTQEALSRSSTQDAFSSSSSRSRGFSSSTWEPSSNGLSDSPARDSMVRECPLFLQRLA